MFVNLFVKLLFVNLLIVTAFIFKLRIFRRVDSYGQSEWHYDLMSKFDLCQAYEVSCANILCILSASLFNSLSCLLHSEAYVSFLYVVGFSISSVHIYLPMRLHRADV